MVAEAPPVFGVPGQTESFAGAWRLQAAMIRSLSLYLLGSCAVAAEAASGGTKDSCVRASPVYSCESAQAGGRRVGYDVMQ